MKLLNIDHSFSRTAYSVLDEYKLLCTGSFELDGMSYQNVLDFEGTIMNLIDIHKPDIIITEKPAHMRNPNIARMLTSLHTVCILSAMRNGLPYDTVNPKHMKKVITGNGSASKEDVFNSLIKDYNYPEYLLCNKTYYKNNPNKIKKIDYDESDSVGIGICYLKERDV